MAESNILNIGQVAETQNNRYITINNAINALEQAGNKRLNKTVSGTSDVTLTTDECTRNQIYHPSGGSGNFNLVFKASIGTGGNTADRAFWVWNASSYNCTVKADSAGTTVVLAAGEIAFIQQAGVDMTLMIKSSASGIPYDFGFFVPDQPDDAAIVCEFVAVRAFTLADDFAGSQGHCGTNPSSTAAFDVQKNNSSIGSISISTGGVFTFNTTGGGVSMSVGDRLKIIAPSPQDATLANVSVVFLGAR